MLMAEDKAFVERLRAGDERAYRELVRRHHGSLVRLAKVFCYLQASAEEVVQDSWLAMVTKLDTYSGEAPLRSWICGIVVNKARTRAKRDGRMRSFSEFIREGDEDGETGLDLDRFASGGVWTDPPLPWDGITPEREVAGRQLVEHLAVALEKLPPAQRAVVLMRDVEGVAPEQICQMLDTSEANLRVLLHRARTKLRAAMEAVVAPPRRKTGSAS